MKGQSVIHSSKYHAWRTPPTFWKPIDAVYHFKLDAATDEDNHLGTPFFYTEKDNGLELPWMDPTWVNPPFNEIESWVKKAEWENAMNDVRVVMLCGANVGTSWFHKRVYLMPGVETIMIRKRIPFTKRPWDMEPGEKLWSSGRDCMLVIWHNSLDRMKIFQPRPTLPFIPVGTA